ncbi:MAG TPA: hypothetical protein DDW52_06150 [Planctomycetaceae bacterium]|nr:hypothetical protein [Planctomycetaceae bacterium]
MGQPRQRSIAAQMSLSQFWAEHGLSSKNDDLLDYGFQALSLDEQARYFGLADWSGIWGLKESLKGFVGADLNWTTLFASRTTKLMELALDWISNHGNSLLYPDCTWPAYAKLIESKLGQRGVAFEVETTLPSALSSSDYGWPSGRVSCRDARH